MTFSNYGLTGPRTLVIKLGGSLLDWPELAVRLQELLAKYADRPCLLIVGGGAAADVVRNWDRIHQLPLSMSHALAVRSMSLTARFVAELLSFTHVASIAAANLHWSWEQVTQPLVLDVAQEVLADSHDRLPASWDVTSDAIAIWIARRMQQADLLFVKSTDWPVGATWDTAAALDLVDAYTPKLLGAKTDFHSMQVGWVNLRSAAIVTYWITEQQPDAATLPTGG